VVICTGWRVFMDFYFHDKLKMSMAVFGMTKLRYHSKSSINLHHPRHRRLQTS